jgi:hypothetical protein
MVSRENLNDHLVPRDAIRSIEWSLYNLLSLCYEPEELKANSIQAFPMSLTNEGSPLPESCFFKPCEKELVDPDPENMGMEFPRFGEHGGFTARYTPRDATDPMSRYFEHCISFFRFTNPKKPVPDEHWRKYATPSKVVYNCVC